MHQRKIRNRAERTAIVDNILHRHGLVVKVNKAFETVLASFLDNATAYCYAGSFEIPAAGVTVSYELPGKRIHKHVVQITKSATSIASSIDAGPQPSSTPSSTPTPTSTTMPSSAPVSNVTNRIL
jgi:hypothetical protein